MWQQNHPEAPHEVTRNYHLYKIDTLNLSRNHPTLIYQRKTQETTTPYSTTPKKLETLKVSQSKVQATEHETNSTTISKHQ